MTKWRCRCADLDGATICEFCYRTGKKAKSRERSGVGAGREKVMRKYRVRATLSWDEATPEGARQRIKDEDFGPCLDFKAATEVLVAVAGRESCLGASIVTVDADGLAEEERR